MHLYSLCQTWLTLKTHTVSETENRTSCLTRGQEGQEDKRGVLLVEPLLMHRVLWEGGG